MNAFTYSFFFFFVSADGEDAILVEESPTISTSNSKGEETSSHQSIVDSSHISPMEDATEIATLCHSIADASTNSTYTNVQSVDGSDDADAAILDSDKSNRVSEITNLSAEEEDALLKIEGDTEVNDDDMNEDMLLAESADEEEDPEINENFSENVPNCGSTTQQTGDECETSFSNIVGSNEIASTANDLPSEAVDSIFNEIMANLDTCENLAAVNTDADESSINDTTKNDREFDSLHVSSSSELDESAGFAAITEPALTESNDAECNADPINQSTSDWSTNDLSRIEVPGKILHTHNSHLNSLLNSLTPANHELLSDPAHAVNNESACNENDKPHAVERLPNMEANPIIDDSSISFPGGWTVDFSGDVIVENVENVSSVPDVSEINQQSDTETFESINYAAAAENASPDVEQTPVTLYEQSEVDNGVSIDSDAAGAADINASPKEIIPETNSQDYSNTAYPVPMADGELIELDSTVLQPDANKMDAVDIPESTVIHEQLDSGELWNASANAALESHTENDDIHSNEFDPLLAEDVENDPEIAPVAVEQFVESGESQNEGKSLQSFN